MSPAKMIRITFAPAGAKLCEAIIEIEPGALVFAPGFLYSVLLGALQSPKLRFRSTGVSMPGTVPSLVYCQI